MKKLIIVTVMALCLALCAAVWPRGETVGGTPHPTQELTASAPETSVVAHKEETEVLPQTEKEKANPPQPELPMEAVPEPEPVPTEIPVVPEAQPTSQPSPPPKPAPNPAPVEPVTDPQPDNMVYVPGFGWLESQGEGSVIHVETIYENGNKVGSMD